jgi:hypothetical protein
MSDEKDRSALKGDSTSVDSSTIEASKPASLVDPVDVPVEKPSETADDHDQYPHGLKLVLLSGSALVAVFLIALDQVCLSHVSIDTTAN